MQVSVCRDEFISAQSLLNSRLHPCCSVTNNTTTCDVDRRERQLQEKHHVLPAPLFPARWDSKVKGRRSSYLTSCQQLAGWPFNVCVCVCTESLNTKETAGLRFNLIIYTGNKKAALYSSLHVEKCSDVKYVNVCKAKMQKEEERIEMSKSKLDKRLSETAESVDIRSSESSC